jgi:hypothetical protein
MIIPYSGKFAKGKAAYDNIAELHNELCKCTDKTVVIKLTHNGRVGRTFVFLIGCLIELGKKNDKQVRLRLPERIMNHAEDMDILQYYNTNRSNLLQFRLIKSKKDVLDIAREIVTSAPVTLDSTLEEPLVSKIGEIYNNAVEHSDTEYIMAGRYYKARINGRKRFCFACYDAGIGIIEKIRNYFKKNDRDSDDKELLEWALAKGNSTSENDKIPRGLGLDLLLSFAKANDGVVRICTSRILFEQKNGNKKFSRLKNSFKGTLFEMDIIADNNYTYILG